MWPADWSHWYRRDDRAKLIVPDGVTELTECAVSVGSDRRASLAIDDDPPSGLRPQCGTPVRVFHDRDMQARFAACLATGNDAERQGGMCVQDAEASVRRAQSVRVSFRGSTAIRASCPPKGKGRQATLREQIFDVAITEREAHLPGKIVPIGES